MPTKVHYLSLYYLTAQGSLLSMKLAKEAKGGRIQGGLSYLAILSVCGGAFVFSVNPWYAGYINELLSLKWG